MEKFLDRFMSLDSPRREKFLQGLEAGFWGNDNLSKKGLPEILRNWLHSADQHHWTLGERKSAFAEFIAASELGQIAKGSLLNLFSQLNHAFEEALPILEHLVPKPANIQAIIVATHWMNMQETQRAESVMADLAGKPVFTEDEIEAWYHFHRAYFNYWIHTGQDQSQSQAVEFHFEQSQKFNTALTTLRTLRLLCAEASLVRKEGRGSPWNWRSVSEWEQSHGRSAIEAYQNCLSMMTGHAPDLEGTWWTTWEYLKHSAFPQNTTESRQITRFLLNIAIFRVNQGHTSKEWYRKCLRLYEHAFSNKNLLENGFLPSQHLINYCSFAVHCDEAQQVRSIVNKYSKDLSITDLHNGEDQFCQALIHYALSEYDLALAALEEFHPTWKRKRTFYVLKIKIMAESDDEHIEDVINSFSKWLRHPKNHPETTRMEVELQRLKLVKRIMNIQKGNKLQQAKLWKDIHQAPIDQDWLKTMFQKRFRIPIYGQD